MNKDRRQRIDDVKIKLTELNEEVQALHDEEEEAFDSMPESLRESEKGEGMTEAVNALETAFSEIESACDLLGTAWDVGQS